MTTEKELKLLHELETYIDGIESYSKNHEGITKCIMKIREIIQDLEEGLD